MFIDNYRHFCELKGVSPTTALKEIGISNSSYDCWKKGSAPTNPSKKRMAEYFGISVEELMSGEKKEKPATVSSNEPLGSADEFFKNLAQLTPENKQRLLDYAKVLALSQANSPDNQA